MHRPESASSCIGAIPFGVGGTNTGIQCHHIDDLQTLYSGVSLGERQRSGIAEIHLWCCAQMDTIPCAHTLPSLDGGLFRWVSLEGLSKFVCADFSPADVKALVQEHKQTFEEDGVEGLVRQVVDSLFQRDIKT